MIADLLTRPIFRCKWCSAFFWCALLSLCFLRAYVGLACVERYSHDAFVMFDGAWRMLNGQRPHLDFSSMMGPAAYLPTVVGLRLASNTATGFGYGQALMGLVCGIWAYGIGRSFSDVSRAAYACCVTVVAVSPALIGPSPLDITPGMTYNHYMYALLMLLIPECLDRKPGFELLRGFSTGLVLSLLAFLKVTGLAAGLVFVVAFWPLRPQTVERWLGLVAGAMMMAVSFLAYLHFDAMRVFRDLSLMAGAKHIAFAEMFDYNTISFEMMVSILLVGGSALWLQAQGHRKEASRLVYVGVVILSGSLVLILGNFQRSGFPLMTVNALVVVEALIANGDRGDLGERWLRSIMLSANAGVVVLTLASSLVTFAACLHLKMHSSRSAPHYLAAPLKPFVGLSHEEAYTNFVNDGTSLLEANYKPGEHVMSLDFSNPFSFALQLPPARGGATTLQYQSSFDKEHRLSPEDLLGSAELVMVPLKFSDPSLDEGSLGTYIDYLHRRYRLVASSSSWQLYRRS